ncbi:MAG: DNA repair protein RecO [Patescibacteria group bacterium]
MARYQAIVLKKQPIREHDELIMCYTQHAGKQRYVAKSSQLASSLQGSHLDVLNHISFNLVAGKHFDILASAQAVNTFPELKSSLSALANTFFILECFDKLVYDNEPDEKLWQFLLDRLGDPVTEQEIIAIMGHHAPTRFSELTRARIVPWIPLEVAPTGKYPR